jgi:uncharacterized protein YnzC (UPF0291/DUF896 family)
MTRDEIRREMRELRITPDDLAGVSELTARQIESFLTTDDSRDAERVEEAYESYLEKLRANYRSRLERRLGGDG